MLLCDNIVRRADLDLRCYSIGLETEIYQINQHHHIIYCKNYNGDFDALRNYFHENIRPMGYQIQLSQEVPQKFASILKQIPFSDVVDGFKGSFITRPDIETAIIDRFPDVEIYDIKIVEGINFSITVKVAPETTLAKMKEMEQVLLDIDLGTNQIIVCTGEKRTARTEDSQNPFAAILKSAQLGITKKLLFTVDEAEFWFENASKIYDNSLKRDSIPKFYKNSTSCFVDYTIINNVNLRNVLLLYDVAYLALPVAKNFEKFLSSQKISKADLLALAEMGKVVFVLVGPEEGYDAQFLIDAYQCNALSILGRRGINSIVAAFLSETKEKFLLHFPQAIEVASDISVQAKRNNDQLMLGLSNFFAWPITGTLNSFKLLNLHGPIAYGSFGLDDMLISTLGVNNQQATENIQMLLNAEGSKIFMSSALNSTLFACNIGNVKLQKACSALDNIVSDLLRLYWYDVNSLRHIQCARDQALQPHQVISLFDCKENISIKKVAILSEEYNTCDIFRRILTNLGYMDADARASKIRQYNDLLFDLTSTAPNRSKLDFVLSASSFLPLPSNASIALSTLSEIKNIVCRTKVAQETAEYKRIEKCIKDAGLQSNQQLVEEIHVLDKISSVAYLK